MEAAKEKNNYKKDRVLEPFFTGGAARVSRDGKLVACVCGDEVKVGIHLWILRVCTACAPCNPSSHCAPTYVKPPLHTPTGRGHCYRFSATEHRRGEFS